MDDQVAAAIRGVPLFQGQDLADLDCERLGGLTNLVYRIAVGEEAYCLRIPGEGTGEYIDRKVEAHNARVAASAGVSPEVLHFGDEGVMVTRYLEGCATMTPESFPLTPGAPTRAAKAFKQMHECGLDFEFRFEVFSMIDDYLGILAKKDSVQLPEGYHQVVEQAAGIRAILDATAVPLAPCHCDPLCENFLDDGQRMWIVDWEYSGMNDPYWDLGDLSVEAGFGPEQDAEMMAAYCGGEVPPAIMGRMVIYKALCDLLWTLWGLIQHANENPVDDFWAYATNRFSRCKALMAMDDFARHLEAVRLGNGKP